MLHRILIPCSLILLVAPAAPQDVAPQLARNVLRPPRPFHLEPGVHRENVVVLKFAEGARVRLLDGELHSLAGADLHAVRAALGGTAIARYFTRAVADLDAERRHAAAQVPPGYPPPADLNNYYRVQTRGACWSETLIDRLNTLPAVETAYAEFSEGALVMVDDIPPPTPLFEASQGYLDPPPSGYGYNTIKSIIGARGEDIAVGHLEGSWFYDHEDAENLVSASVVGALPGSSWDSWRNHGTACVGIINATRNAYGVRGMASGARLLLSSLQNGAANMISLCTAAAAPGDVFTSSYAWAWSNNTVMAPADYPQASFDAIYTAALQGITYCFAAGNTNLDLGDPAIFGTRYAPGAADSGGVIVGASSGSSLNKAGFSNYGARVDCQGWGSSVTTLGYGRLFDPGDVRQRYTDRFGGTSAAAPQAAGVAAVISNVVREQQGVQLTPFQIRDLMRTFGTPQGSGGHIGPRPDLGQILAQHGLPDGLLLTQEGTPGGSWAMALSGTPGQPWILLGALARGRTAAGLNRDVLVDINGIFVVPGTTFDPAGQSTLGGSIPADPLMQGMQLYFQLAELLPGGDLHLGNSIELYVQ